MNDVLQNFWGKATFLPHDEPSRSDSLLEKVRERHQAAFIAYGLKLLFKEPQLYKETGFAELFESFKSSSAERRRFIVEHPVFLVWLKQLSDPSLQHDALEAKLAESKRVIGICDKDERSTADNHAADVVKIDGSSICLARFIIDPLIAQATLPEYRFPDARRQQEFEEKVVYPESFFKEMVSLALERIKQAWPEAHREFPKFVKIIVDMIDADFTSYSACDHSGVIFVSTDNSPLIALEEYLIHELGHQILYNVMELDPLVLDETERVYKLPWSGQERNLYGYFHALYIYVFLAHYYRRIEHRSGREQRRAADRIAHIVKGLNKAVLDFEDAACFTPKGKQLFENLKLEIQLLQEHFVK